MPEAIMAYPDLRHPFEKKAINPAGGTTILYDGKAVSVASSNDNGPLVTPAELTKINGFELKPEGACFEDLCIPLRDDSGILVQDGDQQLIDLAVFADLLGQVYVADKEHAVWSFGEIPAKRDNLMNNAMAPDLEVTDRQGNVVRLADLKGKKALIVTWSSW